MRSWQLSEDPASVGRTHLKSGSLVISQPYRSSRGYAGIKGCGGREGVLSPISLPAALSRHPSYPDNRPLFYLLPWVLNKLFSPYLGTPNSEDCTDRCEAELQSL